MKKLKFLPVFALLVSLSGCFDTVQEISIRPDGSGTYRLTNDLGNLLSLLKEMDPATAKKFEHAVRDTSYSLASVADSTPGLTAEEKELFRAGRFEGQMNAAENKFRTAVSFDFSRIEQVPVLRKLSGFLGVDALQRQIANLPNDGDLGMDIKNITSADDYYIITYAPGSITRTLNKEKHADLAKDEYLQALRQASLMGISSSNTIVINLPSPAKKVEGLQVKTSADGKQVTVTGSLDDLYDDPAKLEFRIEY
ncbi:MAG TPA: hypothetical protein VEB63_06940 [Chitinophagaceae bacterium]|nr:hypothetical protein [Chitinophagaceae bacterium]